MKILIDMNLSPKWCDVFARQDWDALHWSNIGEPTAPDATVMTWAREHGYVLFTYDLDFGAMLAYSRSGAPSVIQVRTRDLLAQALQDTVVSAIRQCEQQLIAGALVVIEPARARIRLLPLQPRDQD